MLAALVLVVEVISLLTTEYVLTNKRVIVQRRFLSRSSLELLLTQVEGVGIDQRLIGQLLNFGTIIITGTGGLKERFKNIPKPMEFRQQVQEQLQALGKL
jgi:uncharacterized membrane protein YdbT with pleckstrin-like domain